MANRTFTIGEILNIAYTIKVMGLRGEDIAKAGISLKTYLRWTKDTTTNAYAVLYNRIAEEFDTKELEDIKNDLISKYGSLDIKVFDAMKEELGIRKRARISLDLAKAILNTYENLVRENDKTKISDLKDYFPEVAYQVLVQIINRKGKYENLDKHVISEEFVREHNAPKPTMENILGSLKDEKKVIRIKENSNETPKNKMEILETLPIIDIPVTEKLICYIDINPNLALYPKKNGVKPNKIRIEVEPYHLSKLKEKSSDFFEMEHLFNIFRKMELIHTTDYIEVTSFFEFDIFGIGKNGETKTDPISIKNIFITLINADGIVKSSKNDAFDIYMVMRMGELMIKVII